MPVHYEQNQRTRTTWTLNLANPVERSCKRFIINNNIIENELRIANESNNYFISITPILAAIQETTILNPLDFLQNNPNSMAIRQIEVINIINSINNSSPGWDGIPSLLAKKVINLYIKPLSFIINQSFHDGIFTDELKLEKKSYPS